MVDPRLINETMHYHFKKVNSDKILFKSFCSPNYTLSQDILIHILHNNLMFVNTWLRVQAMLIQKYEKFQR